MNLKKSKFKRIAVIGGGISGLATLHYLCRKYCKRDDIEIKLFEKEKFPGGTIHSQQVDKHLFEHGPNGFLTINPLTLEFFHEIQIADQLIVASAQAKKRFISYQNQLYPVPMNPVALFKFPLFSAREKIRIFQEFFQKAGTDPKESVFDFFQRRFGPRVAQLFLDPMVSGIYAGDAKKISVRAAFPKIYALEQTYGSVIKGLFKQKRDKKIKRKLVSLKDGMGSVIEKLYTMYRVYIHTKIDVASILQKEEKYCFKYDGQMYDADEIFLCAPAYGSSYLLKELNKDLAELLNQFEYAPIAVVGLVYAKSAFKNFPQGFGYLIPSSERRQTLGVLFESLIFANRCAEDEILVRVMIGGSRHPEVEDLSEDEISALALQEINQVLKAEDSPKQVYIKKWRRGIPQYTQTYLALRDQLEQLAAQFPRLHFCANYLKGISFNDCIENAYHSANKSLL
ncbi:MAG: protoporphyrinogen oxidase [Candidatus Omnitrophica bacterium]|nr:protoporphyrinogen oxidase [Candidatus Omnitrophota bacterium]